MKSQSNAAAERVEPGEIDADAIVAAYKDGQSIQRISTNRQIARRRIRKILAEADVPVSRGRTIPQRRYDLDERADQIAEEYRRGDSVATLAGRYAASRDTILDRLHASGATLRPDDIAVTAWVDVPIRPARIVGWD